MIIEACQLIDDEIDFTKYDTDGDGVSRQCIRFLRRTERGGWWRRRHHLAAFVKHRTTR